MLSLLQDWTTISGTGTGGNFETVTQTAASWPNLDEYSNITFWLEVRDVSVSFGTATLAYQTSPTADESFFMTMGTVVMAASPTPTVTKIRLADNPAVALARFIRWSITVQGGSTVWSATFRIFFVAAAGVEGPRGIPGDTSGLRLTLTSGTPVTTADTVGTTLYFTPFNHAQLLLNDGVSWNAYTTPEVSLSPTLGLNSTYDVFARYDPVASAVVLELSNAWSSDTTRTDPVARLDGILVKTGDVTRRLVGTVRTDANARFVDNGKQRFVWNVQNRVDRFLSVTDGAASWTYATSSYRAAHNNTANAFEFVAGDVAIVEAKVQALAEGSGAGQVATVGIGVDSTTVNSAQIFGKTTETAGVGSDSIHAEYQGYTAAGHHTITWLEYAGTTITFFGTNGSPAWQVSGMNGRVMA